MKKLRHLLLRIDILIAAERYCCRKDFSGELSFWGQKLSMGLTSGHGCCQLVKVGGTDPRFGTEPWVGERSPPPTVIVPPTIVRVHRPGLKSSN